MTIIEVNTIMMHHNFKLLGKILDPSLFSEYVANSSELPVVRRRYGSTFNHAEGPHWLTYQMIEGTTIGFLRNPDLHPALKQMVDIAIPIFEAMFQGRIPVNRAQISFTRNQGNVKLHTDEGSRTAAINIGLLNSASSRVGVIASDGETMNEFMIEDGYGYLLNTSAYHKVEGDPKVVRYLLSYEFIQVQFERLKDIIHGFD
jgi:hypothetical protein